MKDVEDHVYPTQSEEAFGRISEEAQVKQKISAQEAQSHLRSQTRRVSRRCGRQEHLILANVVSFPRTRVALYCDDPQARGARPRTGSPHRFPLLPSFKEAVAIVCCLQRDEEHRCVLREIEHVDSLVPFAAR